MAAAEDEEEVGRRSCGGGSNSTRRHTTRTMRCLVVRRGCSAPSSRRCRQICLTVAANLLFRSMRVLLGPKVFSRIM